MLGRLESPVRVLRIKEMDPIKIRLVRISLCQCELREKTRWRKGGKPMARPHQVQTSLK